MPLHLEKKAIRALGIAESFVQSDKLSTLAGVVMRTDLVIDGLAIGKLVVSGFDSTIAIQKLYDKLGRNDVNVLLLSGSVLSMYNVVDVDALNDSLGLPIVALTFKRSRADLEKNILARFDEKVARRKIALLEKLGKPAAVELENGYTVYVRGAGILEKDARTLLNRFTLQGGLPEPVRVARLLAKAARQIKSR
jgi:endonuclease V-like protein UPF0215 family